MAKSKTPSKKKTVAVKKATTKKKATATKKAAPKKKVSKKKSAPVFSPIIRSIVMDELVIELCGPGKRCKQKPDGNFIRQNFISGRWQQVGGTVFPTLEACKNACSG
jgi:hypothetical protein